MILKAVLDANVLYPAPLRDLLMSLATRDLFVPIWTEIIFDEWMRNVLKNLPHISLERLERTKSLMLQNVPQALITGFEPLIPELLLPDPDDRHVLAAAIHAHADLIVTHNLKDFPNSVLERYGVEAISPDPFVMKLVEDQPDQVLAALRKQRSRLKNPPSSQAEFLATLELHDLKVFVNWIRKQGEPI